MAKIIASSGVPIEQIYCVCDESRDITACKKVKIKTITVTWGYQSKKLLSAYSPDIIVDVPEDILNVL